MGLMNDTEHRVRLLIDEDVLGHTCVGCHPCINTSSIRIPTEEMLQKVIPALAHPPQIVKLPRYE